MDQVGNRDQVRRIDLRETIDALAQFRGSWLIAIARLSASVWDQKLSVGELFENFGGLPFVNVQSKR